MQIDALDDNDIIGFAIMNAIGAMRETSDYHEKLVGKGRMVDFVTTVNGVEIDLSSALREMWDRLEKSVDKRVEERAVELISGTKFQKLFLALERAEWEIKDAIRESLGKSIDSD